MRAKLARFAVAVTVLIVLAPGALCAIGAASASAVTCRSWSGGQPPNPPALANTLNGVSVLSSCDAWAVGWTLLSSGVHQTLIEHWNGATWKIVPSPDPGGSLRDNELLGVASDAAHHTWAVGFYSAGTAWHALTMHWNGHVWKVVASPNRGGSSGSFLRAVHVNSSHDGWAVGESGTPSQTLIEHWNGAVWKVVKSPNPGGSTRDNFLVDVTATSASNAWAVGQYDIGMTGRTVVAHWNGTAWKSVKSPNPGGSPRSDVLSGVAAVSGHNAWAVGSYFNGTVDQPLVVHWNGTAWKVVKSPSPGGSAHPSYLADVASSSAQDVWAVGVSGSLSQTLIVHWNGSTWKVVPSPDPGGPAIGHVLISVAASSASNAWAVGSYGSPARTLALHWR